jgi:Vacuolar protein 14 C-terminal Fig4p binding
MLIRLSQITKLIDMPHYAALRMQLLRPKKYPKLIDSLKGILMLLPQGKAFDSLKSRLECSTLVFDSNSQQDSPVENKMDLNTFVNMIIKECPELFSAHDLGKLAAQLD